MSVAHRHDVAKDLLPRFRHLFCEPPGWAWRFKPSVPLVGHNYKPSESIIVYASAENFSWMHRKDIPARFKDERAWDRYRACLEEGNEGFFPDVGIQPATDGGLLAAALFVSLRTGLTTSAQPRAFVETIAVSNWCKFAIKSANNEDYISNVSKLAESLPFVVTELAVLAPKLVLLPQAVWRHTLLCGAMRGASPFTLFLPVPQFNTTVVNCHLTKFDLAARKLRAKFKGKPLAEWMRNLYGFREENAWRYLAYLDEVLVQEGVRPLAARKP